MALVNLGSETKMYASVVRAGSDGVATMQVRSLSGEKHILNLIHRLYCYFSYYLCSMTVMLYFYYDTIIII